MNQQPGVVIWRGQVPPGSDETFRIVLVPTKGLPRHDVEVESMETDLTGNDSWRAVATDEEGHKPVGDILEQAILDLVAALQKASTPTQPPSPSVAAQPTAKNRLKP